MTRDNRLETPSSELVHTQNDTQLKVYYDAACPLCRRERQRYESWQNAAKGVAWLDVNTHHEHLLAQNIVPRDAILSLHVEDTTGYFYEGIDAYVVLMRRVPRLRPLAWLIALPILKPLLTWLYKIMVKRRLAREGRL